VRLARRGLDFAIYAKSHVASLTLTADRLGAGCLSFSGDPVLADSLTSYHVKRRAN
jgi:hypothetical protein